MSSPLRFALVGTGQSLIACGNLILSRGHQISAVHSDCPEVTSWAARAGMVVRRMGDADWSWDEPLDYLLSVVNHTILPREVIEAPTRCAINYHDSLLPEYAGFNATAWAILDGRKTHGITWHVMTADADRGDILLQQTVEITDDDTAFTLGVKCSEAGIAAFAQLLGQMEQGALSPAPQPAGGSFHLRSDRPGLAILDLACQAAEVSATVRALEFASEDNWMTRPKLVSGNACVLVSSARIVSGPARPGDVIDVDDDAIAIGAGTAPVRLSGFSTLDGEPVTGREAASRLGLGVGGRLTSAPVPAGTARDFDAGVTKAERFWVGRLESIQPAVIEGIRLHEGPPRPRLVERELPKSLASLDSSRRESTIFAAIAAYLHRLGQGSGADIAVDAEVPASLAQFYAAVVPARLPVNASQSFRDTVDAARTELETLRNRVTYARDAVTRYARLRELRGRIPRLAVGARFPGRKPVAAEHALVPGTGVTFHLLSDRTYAIGFDDDAVTPSLAADIADGFHALLASVSESEGSALASLPVMSAEKRHLLLDTWQQTARPYDASLCIHQLFERQADQAGSRPAATFDGQTWSYEELNRKSNAIAQALRESGVGPNSLVALCVDRSLEMVAGLLGILKAGAAYVPLDPAYPSERLAMMLEDSGARVILSRRHLLAALPAMRDTFISIDDVLSRPGRPENPSSGVSASDLAYVIFTSGSTGRPKGTMVAHRNVANFFAGMDDVMRGDAPGVWLAVTSISFDISVLELFWTLARGFHVIIAPESDRASLKRKAGRAAETRSMEFGLFYFAADSGAATTGDAYRLLLEGARFADENGFTAVWTPERHFHAFGGLYPNPAVTTAALSTITKRVHLRAGSVVLPLHNPLRVAEDWAVIDQLSGGRVGLSFASGWHVNDFAFMPENFERRREIMLEHIETVMKLWRGERVAVRNGAGKEIEVAVLPRPIQKRPPIWIASAGSVETFQLAGRLGANVLTNMLGQDLDDLRAKFAAYRAARKEHGHAGEGTISVMLHTFVTESDEEARRLARKPFSDYLASSFDLVKVAPKMFPAFRQPSKKEATGAIDADAFTAEDMEALMSHAFERYYETAGLFGTPESALEMIDRLAGIGATEIACLIDFGIDPDKVLESLPHLDRLRRLAANRPVSASVAEHGGFAELMRRHQVTHLQCTPSMARALLNDPETATCVSRLARLLVGGEALPEDLAQRLATTVEGSVLNMYGPTETTVWSTVSAVAAGRTVTIGRPIANTTIRILDRNLQLVPIGIPGELFIGGDGVVPGYLNQPDLTAERFVPDPWRTGQRLYRTGDLARYLPDGDIEFLGRLDHQVKINGYRVELGEIEAALARHAGVRQCVVVARADGKSQRLVAYVVPSPNQSIVEQDADRVAAWQTLWSETYRSSTGTADARFRVAGWNDSYSGEPIPAVAMEEWLTSTVERVRGLSPRRVLEIGCGTGMILFRMLPHVDHYTGVDVSPEALQSIRNELSASEAAKTTLMLQPADALTGIPDRSSDLVIINSVAQYFPSVEYLERVLRRAAEVVVDGGTIFIGDLRSLEHLEAFHGSVELHHAAGVVDAAQLRARISRRVDSERELVVSEGFFHDLAARVPRFGRVDVEIKRGRHQNELTRFRYDVFLRVGGRASVAAAPSPTTLAEPSASAIRGAIASRPDSLLLLDVPNARLAGWTAARHKVFGNETVDIDAMKKLLDEPVAGAIDPETLYTIDPEYDVSVRWSASGDPATIDALLSRTDNGKVRASWPARTVDGAAKANAPLRQAESGSLVQRLKEHLGQTLPEYMVPPAFVVIDALPLTPNGKIDRKALPDPDVKATVAVAEYVAPTTDLERLIAEVWQELLAVDRVSRQGNIFDLGANSLLTMQANNRLSAVLGRRVSLVSMFKYPTVASLAAHLGGDEAPSDDKRSQERANRAEQAASRRRALRAERKDQ